MADQVDDVILVERSEIIDFGVRENFEVLVQILVEFLAKASERAEVIAEERGLGDPIAMQIIDSDGKCFYEVNRNPAKPNRYHREFKPDVIGRDDALPWPWFVGVTYPKGTVKIRVQFDDQDLSS
jgi:hypothetical protein